MFQEINNLVGDFCCMYLTAHWSQQTMLLLEGQWFTDLMTTTLHVLVMHINQLN